MVEAYRVKKQQVNNVRAELGLTQEGLAERAGVSPTAIINAERGRPIRRLTAHKILKALNGERERTGKPALDIDELAWDVVN